jgi:hypothetical protein
MTINTGGAALGTSLSLRHAPTEAQVKRWGKG